MHIQCRLRRVAFGLFGTVLVYANAASVMPQAEMAIFWSEVLKQSSLLDPTLMLLAFVFVLIGFGTKTGLFPMHAWLPDAHSEAPSPVSALLSAVLLNCALLVLIRYYIIICQAIGSDFPNRLLLIFGMLSVAVASKRGIGRRHIFQFCTSAAENERKIRRSTVGQIQRQSNIA